MSEQRLHGSLQGRCTWGASATTGISLSWGHDEDTPAPTPWRGGLRPHREAPHPAQGPGCMNPGKHTFLEGPQVAYGARV